MIRLKYNIKKIKMSDRLSVIKKTVTKTCIEMLEQRGCSILDIEGDYLLAEHNQEKYKIMVFLTLLEKFNTESLVTYTSILNNLGIRNGIAIHVDGITPRAKQDIKILQDIISIELFHYKELMFNITKHVLQPNEFYKLPENEAKELKDNYGTKFPSMKTSDAIARFYAYKRGDIIRITRRDGNVIYRIVKA